MTFMKAIEAARAAYPDLGVSGFGSDDQDWQQYEEAFAVCLEVIDMLPKVVAVSKGAPSSYGLKHDAEKLAERRGKSVYVANGVMIVALHHRGLKAQRNGPNAFTNLSGSARNHLFNLLHNNTPLPKRWAAVWSI